MLLLEARGGRPASPAADADPWHHCDFRLYCRKYLV